MDVKTKIVIGSNIDFEFLQESINDKSLIVYAFEPNPYLFSKTIINNLPNNYKLIQKAVSNKKGKSIFNITKDGVSSSLNNFSVNTKLIESTIEVETIKMEDFIQENNIKKIDFLHIDAQGSDYEILKGFGNKISIVQEGVCESMAPDLDWTLYENQSSFEDFKEFFFSNGFDISYKPNTGGIGEKEINIFFKKTKDKSKIIKKIL